MTFSNSSSTESLLQHAYVPPLSSSYKQFTQDRRWLLSLLRLMKLHCLVTFELFRSTTFHRYCVAFKFDYTFLSFMYKSEQVVAFDRMRHTQNSKPYHNHYTCMHCTITLVFHHLYSTYQNTNHLSIPANIVAN